jgi:hypothetical protein
MIKYNFFIDATHTFRGTNRGGFRQSRNQAAFATRGSMELPDSRLHLLKEAQTFKIA